MGSVKEWHPRMAAVCYLHAEEKVARSLPFPTKRHLSINKPAGYPRQEIMSAMKGKFTFSKAERLNKEKDIQELFDKGSSFYLFPFKVLTLPATENSSRVNQVLISVSRRIFKKAVDRNKLKRRVREAYRLQKEILLPAPFQRIGFIYTHKEILTSAEISAKMVHALRKISRHSAAASRPS
jgi:ribonuclease P protein component